MGKFTFSISGRKKAQPPQLPNLEPMSKAHKILGSTPLNFDSLRAWDDASSSSISIGTLETNTPSNAASDDGLSDDQVKVTGVQTGWGDEFDRFPRSPNVNTATGNEKGAVVKESHSTLRKSQSSSTIKSWYDKSKPPLSSGHPTMTKDSVSKAHKMLDVDNVHGPVKTKKKPPMLDFSNLVPGSKPARKNSRGTLDVDGFILSPGQSIRSPSLLSPFTPSSFRHSEMRKMQKRRTKDSALSPTLEVLRSANSGSNRSMGSSGSRVSGLFNHYEQMSLRQVMKVDIESDGGSDSPRNSEDPTTQIRRREPDDGKNLDWLHDALPQTPRTTLKSQTDGRPSTAGAQSTISRHTRVSQTPKESDRSLQQADLQQTSVLLLDSDSEDEGLLQPFVASPASLPLRRRSESQDKAPALEDCRPKTTRTPRTFAPEFGKRLSKNMRITPVIPRITIPTIGIKTNVTDDSAASTPFTPFTPLENYQLPPLRDSLMSDFSPRSAVACQIGYTIQEARAITVLPARRPSLSEKKEEPAQTQSPRSNTPASQLEVAATAQITPPLSPTSMDFYIRSARTSIDGSSSPRCFMAVTNGEMLKSGLGNKKQVPREQEVPRPKEQSPPMEEKRESKGHRPQGSSSTFTEAMFEFGFPAPPNIAHRISRRSGNTATPQNDTSAPCQTKTYSDSDGEIALSASTDSLDMSPDNCFYNNLVDDSLDDSEHEDIPLFLDELASMSQRIEAMEDSDTESDDSMGLTADDLFPVAWADHSESYVKDYRDSVPPSARLQASPFKPTHFSRSSSRLAILTQDMGENGTVDMARPDSPISPESFPAVPHMRTTVSNMPRLSAVGAPRLGHGPGWWGDED